MRGLKSIKGLMFNDMRNIDGALITGNSIWMPFVKRKLYLTFLDNKFKVVDKQLAVPLTLNIKTWKTYNCKRASYCLETKMKLPVKKGDKIKLF